MKKDIGEKNRQDWLRPRLDVLNRSSELVPKQAHAIDFVSRMYTTSQIETAGERDVAAAAARTSIVNEVSSRWPGAPYVIRQGPVEEYAELGLEPAKGALLVFAIVYQADA